MKNNSLDSLGDIRYQWTSDVTATIANVHSWHYRSTAQQVLFSLIPAERVDEIIADLLIVCVAEPELVDTEWRDGPVGLPLGP